MARRRGTKGKQKPRSAPALSSEPAPEAHWLTPGVWNRRCAGCGIKGCEVYRHSDQSALCGLCVERLGIVPLESKAWRRYARQRLERVNRS